MKLDATQFRYTPDADKVPKTEVILCGVCGTPCRGPLRMRGPRGYADSLCGKSAWSDYDEWKCPNHGKAWHERIAHMRKWAKSSQSETIKNMIELEIIRILGVTHI